MPSTSAFAETAALVGDPTRAGMLTGLMDGRALTASELARQAGVTPQTASGHLGRLSEAGLLAVERQGRHRYYRLASPVVAQMLEGIMSMAARLGDEAPKRRRVTVGPRDQALRRARTCYDHLAGQLAVSIADRMLERGDIEFTADGGALTETGLRFLSELGVDLDGGAKPGARTGRVFCRPCLDWSERRPHIAGQVGAALCRTCFDRNWIRRVENTRAVTLTPAGRRDLVGAFGLTPEP